MARRVIIDGSGGFVSPLLISVAGVDAATAQFNALIFNGNQPPLRLWGTGFIATLGLSWNQHLSGLNVNEGAPVGVVSVPSGFSPVFMTMWRNSTDSNSIVHTPSSNGSDNGIIGGGGGGICSNDFLPCNFGTGAPAVPTTFAPTSYINYCVFKNYN